MPTVAVALVLIVLTAPLAPEAQPAGRVPQVGYLSTSSPSDPLWQRRFEAFRQSLRELGYVEGQNIAIEVRWAENKSDRLADLAGDLVRVKVDVIVTGGVPAIRAAQEATTTIPIVMAFVSDPVATGLVASLARPGGNVTGLSSMAHDLVGKRLELLKEVVPKASRVAVLWNPTNPGIGPQVRAAEDAARVLGVRLQPLEAREPPEIDSAFAAMTRERAGALMVLPDVMLGSQHRRIADLAVQRRLPAMYAQRDAVEAGGLMSYGVNLNDLHRRAAIYVDKILKGAKPADLPVEQPTKFELLINRRAAKALGITFPQSILLRATEAIE